MRSKEQDAGGPAPALQGNWVIVGGWRHRDGPERGEEVAGLEGLEGGEAGVEVGRGEAPIAVEQAEEFVGGTVALLGVAVEATGDDVAVGVVAVGAHGHGVVIAGGLGVEPTQAVEAGEVLAEQDGGAHAGVMEAVGVVELGGIAFGAGMEAAGDVSGDEDFDTVSGDAALEDADEALLREVAEMITRGGVAGAEATSECAIGNASDAAAFGVGVAQEMVVEGAFAGTEAEVGNEVVFDLAAHLGKVN